LAVAEKRPTVTSVWLTTLFLPLGSSGTFLPVERK
jgi:hypothetical protein